MAIDIDFEYVKPKTLVEVCQYLAKYGNNAKILAGGTDLAVKLKEGQESPHILIDIKGIPEFLKLDFSNDELFIGATITFSDLIQSSIIKNHFPLIWEAATTVASVGTRNRATIVGNICSAVPSLDSGPALLCYEANVLLRSEVGERSISIHDWFLGPKKTAKNEKEVVIGLKIKKPIGKHGSAYVKLGRYRGEDLAQAGLGVLIFENNKYHLAFCALGPIPKRALTIEALLNGKELNEKIFEEAKKLVENEISPITDIRATREYRMHIAKVMVERGLKKAIDRFNGEKLELTNVLGG